MRGAGWAQLTCRSSQRTICSLGTLEVIRAVRMILPEEARIARRIVVRTFFGAHVRHRFVQAFGHAGQVNQITLRQQIRVVRAHDATVRGAAGLRTVTLDLDDALDSVKLFTHFFAHDCFTLFIVLRSLVTRSSSYVALRRLAVLVIEAHEVAIAVVASVRTGCLVPANASVSTRSVPVEVTHSDAAWEHL